MFAGNEGKILTALQLEQRRKKKKEEREKKRKRKKERKKNKLGFFFFFQSKGGNITLTQRNTLTKSRWRKASEK